jgi:hypothetical protein
MGLRLIIQFVTGRHRAEARFGPPERFISLHLVLWLLGNSMVYESLGKGLVMQGEETSPSVHLT